MIGSRGAGANRATHTGRAKADRKAPKPRRLPRLVRWLTSHDWGMYGVGIAAAVLSFEQLDALALACGWPRSIAWLLAVIIDVYAINATRRWLRAGVDGELRKWAARLVWGCVGLSMAGNTVEHALKMGYLRMPDGEPYWWIVVIVGTVPTIMLASLIHLEALSRTAQVRAADDNEETLEEETGRSPLSKRAQLEALLDAETIGDDESNYQVAQRLAPTVDLNVQSATRYIREWRSRQLPAAGDHQVVPLDRGRAVTS